MERRGVQRFSDAENRTNLMPIRKTVQFYTLNSGKLRKALGQVPNFGSYTTEAHHIIPANIINAAFNLKKEKEEFGVYGSYDEAWNGIFLPGYPKNETPEKNHYNLPFHRRCNLPNHNTYDNFVHSKLGGIDLTSDDMYINSQIKHYANELKQIIKKMSDETCLDDINSDSAHSSKQSKGSSNVSSVRRNQYREKRYTGSYSNSRVYIE